MICARCHQAIRPGDAYEELDKFSASGAGTTVVTHKSACPPKPH